MKKTLLLILLTAYSFISHAQNVLLRDSLFLSSDNGATQQFFSEEIYLYDANCRNTIHQFNYNTANPNATMAGFKYLNVYYPDGTLYHQITQNKQTLADSFVNTTRQTFTYTAAKQQATVLTESWNGSSWQPSQLESYTYNSSRKEIVDLLQTWDTVKLSFVKSQQITHSYDAGGKTTDMNTQLWKASITKWISVQDYIYVYDTNEFLIRDSIKANDTTRLNEYLVSSSYYYNNNKGFADSSYNINVFSQDSSVLHNTYFPNTNLIQQTIDYIYRKDINTITAATRVIYIHDSLNNVYTDSTFSQSALPPYFNNFTNTDLNIVKTTYNSSKQITEYISNLQSFAGHFSYYERVENQYGSCQSALPVSFINFTGLRKDNDALLQWQTVNEINTSSFDIQRSTDGISFTTIDKIAAAGNSSLQKNYNYTDKNINLLNSSKVSYRLAEHDNSGIITYIRTTEIDILAAKLSVSISPNPIQNSIVVNFPAVLPNAVIKVTNMSGMTLYTSHQNVTGGSKLIIDASAFPKGMYLVTVQSETNKQILKVIK